MNVYVYTILGHECVHGWVVGIANFYLSAPPPGRLLELPEWWWMLVDTEYSNKLGQTSTLLHSFNQGWIKGWLLSMRSNVRKMSSPRININLIWCHWLIWREWRHMRFLSIIYLIMAWDVAVRRGDRSKLSRGRSAGPLACASRSARPPSPS